VKFPTRLRVAVAVILIGIVLVALGVYLATPPTPIPTREHTVTPTLGPYPKLDLRADFASLEGFNTTEMQFQGNPSMPYTVLVLPQGGSGSIQIMLISTDDKDYTVSLDVGLDVLPGKFEGVRYVFSPTALIVKAGAKVNSNLSIEVDLDAPTAYYGLLIHAYIKEWGGSILINPMSYFGLLIYPYTPSYAYHVMAPTPGLPEPTPTYTPLPWLTPTIAVKPGGTVYIMFDIDKGTSDPTVQVKIDLSCDSGPLPSGMNAEFISDPLKVVPAAPFESVIMLTLTAANDVPKGTYRIIATITVGSYTVQIPFELTATSQK